MGISGNVGPPTESANARMLRMGARFSSKEDDLERSSLVQNWYRTNRTNREPILYQNAPPRTSLLRR